MFIYHNGERYNVLMQGDVGAWVISYDSYHMPVFLDRQHFDRAERIQTPEEYVSNKGRELSESAPSSRQSRNSTFWKALTMPVSPSGKSIRNFPKTL